MLAGAGLAAGRGPTVPRLMGVDTDAALLVTEMYAAPTTTTLIERASPSGQGGSPLSGCGQRPRPASRWMIRTIRGTRSKTWQ